VEITYNSIVDVQEYLGRRERAKQQVLSMFTRMLKRATSLLSPQVVSRILLIHSRVFGLNEMSGTLIPFIFCASYDLIRADTN
jgi:hypothetical protein